MQKTLFDTWALCGILRGMARIWLKLMGWRIEGTLPDIEKFIMIAAPHTSNWDFPYMLAIALQYRIRLFWIGKDSLFKGIAGPVMRWLGGIPIDRSQGQNMVATLVREFSQHEKMVVTIPPEGTRGKVRRWKTGFYHIAHGAELPIVLGFLDYPNKVGGVGPVVHPCGDYEADMVPIKAFYSTITGKCPEKM